MRGICVILVTVGSVAIHLQHQSAQQGMCLSHLDTTIQTQDYLVDMSNGNYSILNVGDAFWSQEGWAWQASLEALFAYYAYPSRIQRYMQMTLTATAQLITKEKNPSLSTIAKIAEKHLTDHSGPQQLTITVHSGLQMNNLTQLLKQSVPILLLLHIEDQGKYAIVTGIRDQEVYLEDPTSMGSPCLIMKEAFLQTWAASRSNHQQEALIIRMDSQHVRPVFPVIEEQM